MIVTRILRLFRRDVNAALFAFASRRTVVAIIVLGWLAAVAIFPHLLPWWLWALLSPVVGVAVLLLGDRWAMEDQRSRREEER